MKANITNVERVDQSVNVEVEFSVNGSFSQKRAFNFNTPMTWTEIQTEIKRVGLQYQNALDATDTLATKIGTSITI